jgi:hypothetical protein
MNNQQMVIKPSKPEPFDHHKTPAVKAKRHEYESTLCKTNDMRDGSTTQKVLDFPSFTPARVESRAELYWTEGKKYQESGDVHLSGLKPSEDITHLIHLKCRFVIFRDIFWLEE